MHEKEAQAWQQSACRQACILNNLLEVSWGKEAVMILPRARHKMARGKNVPSRLASKACQHAPADLTEAVRKVCRRDWEAMPDYCQKEVFGFAGDWSRLKNLC